MNIKYILVSITIVMMIHTQTLACTGIRLIAEDGSVISGRTMEFSPHQIQWELMYVPRGSQFSGETKKGKDGLNWYVKNAFVSYFVKDQEYAVEGVNEKGLVAGLFFFYPYSAASYMEQADNTDNTISGNQIVTWLLSEADSVEDVKKLLPKLNVIAKATSIPGWENIVPLVHYTVYDKTGASIVIEYMGGELVINDNPLGTITNVPEFSWMQENLKQYTPLPVDQTAPIKAAVANNKAGLDVGSYKDLPGRIVSQERFVRAALFSQNATPMKNADEGVVRVLNILNNFDIPNGYKKYGLAGGVELTQIAQWISVVDVTNLRFFFRTAENPQLRMVSLSKLLKYNLKVPTKIKFDNNFSFNEITIN